MSLSIYLGANTAEGFYSYFEKFTSDIGRLYIIKGGPGCGKSTMMKKIARFAESCGIDTVYIYCSSDSDSLDGVYFPQLDIMYVDGTAPHVLEANIPGAREELVDFGQCFDTLKLSESRSQIEKENSLLSRQYADCFAYLSAAGKIMRCTDALFIADRIRLEHQAQRLAKRTFMQNKSKGKGKRHDIFLGSFTKDGQEVRHQLDGYSVYPVFDPFSNSGVIIEKLAEAAISCGYDVYAAHDPYDPSGDAMHILIPSISIAYVTQGRPFGFGYVNGRHIRLDAPKNENIKKTYKRNKKIMESLEICACTSLKNAKEIHDRLEAIYHPCVDFTKVDEITEHHIGILTQCIKSYQR